MAAEELAQATRQAMVERRSSVRQGSMRGLVTVPLPTEPVLKQQTRRPLFSDTSIPQQLRS
eukprot:3734297-Prymnesium_polylepis.1